MFKVNKDKIVDNLVHTRTNSTFQGCSQKNYIIIGCFEARS